MSWEKQVIRRAQDEGWRIKEGGKHVLLYPPDGGRPIPLSRGQRSTATRQPRARKNTEARLRRAGLEV